MENQFKKDFSLIGKPYHIYDMVWLCEQDVFDLYTKMGLDFVHMLSGDFYVEIREGKKTFLVNNGIPVYVNLDDGTFHRYIPKQHSLDRINETFLLMSKLRPSCNMAVNEFLPISFHKNRNSFNYKNNLTCLSYYCFDTLFKNYMRAPDYTIMKIDNGKIVKIINHVNHLMKFCSEFGFKISLIDNVVEHYCKKFSTIYKKTEGRGLLFLSGGLDSNVIRILMDYNDIKFNCYTYSSSLSDKSYVSSLENISLISDDYFYLTKSELYKIWKKFCMKHNGMTSFFNERCLCNLVVDWKNDFEWIIDGTTPYIFFSPLESLFFKRGEKELPSFSFHSSNFSIEKRTRGFCNNKAIYPISDKVFFEIQKLWRNGNKVIFYNKVLKLLKQEKKIGHFISTSLHESEIKDNRFDYSINITNQNENYQGKLNLHFLSVLLYLLEHVYDVTYESFCEIFDNFDKKIQTVPEEHILNILMKEMLRGD